MSPSNLTELQLCNSYNAKRSNALCEDMLPLALVHIGLKRVHLTRKFYIDDLQLRQI